ncbi:hypothetical protein ABT121_30185 [Streptomyces sp. NPDC001928]|uniref:hypothetical protein n=1 Tax=Streptomyces sp. NPDC001928 TaxID=3154404 RepID=UPI00331FD115
MDRLIIVGELTTVPLTLPSVYQAWVALRPNPAEVCVLGLETSNRRPGTIRPIQLQRHLAQQQA